MSRKNRRKHEMAACDCNTIPHRAGCNWRQGTIAHDRSAAYLNSRDTEEQRWHAVWSEVP